MAGVGNHYTALFGEYSPREVHRWNTDPKPVAWESPYAMFRDNPIINIDPLLDYSKLGAKWRNFVNGGNGITQTDGGGKNDWGYKTKNKDGETVFHFGKPRGPGLLAKMEDWNNKLGDKWSSAIKNSKVGEAYNKVDEKLHVHNDQWNASESWEGQGGFEKHGLPTMKATTGVLATVFTGGAFALYIGGGAATTGGVVYGGTALTLSTYNTVSDTKEALTGKGLPGGQATSHVSAALDGFELVTGGNPVSALSLMMYVTGLSQGNNPGSPKNDK